MLNLHCNKNEKKKKKKKKKELSRFVPGMYGFKVHRGIHYAKVINRRVGKMCNPHPRKSNALGKHM